MDQLIVITDLIIIIIIIIIVVVVIEFIVRLSHRGHRCITKVINSNQPNVKSKTTLECGLMPNVMAAQPNIGGALCSTPQSLADAQYSNAVQ